MAKRKINIDFDQNTLAWGINSNQEGYRLCWHFNQYLDWNFERITDIQFYSPKLKDYKYFNAYLFENETDLYSLELIQNKNKGDIFIPEMKNFDFIFLLQGEDDYFDTIEFANLLLKIPGIQSVFPIDINSLKSKQNLITRHLNEPF